MKKPDNSKKVAPKKGVEKTKDSDELRKPVKLKPLKEKDKKGWKHQLDDEEEDFTMDDMKFENDFGSDEEDDYFDDDY